MTQDSYIQYNQLKQQLENVIERIYSLQKDLAMKASLKEVLDLVDQKNNELFENVNSTYDQLITFRDSQNDLNTKLCANNCVARWLFNFNYGSRQAEKGHDVYNVQMAQTSVNACEENYKWNKPNFDGSGKLIPASDVQQSILIVNPGLYEIQMALIFQSEERPLEMRILVDEKVSEIFQLSEDHSDPIKVFDSSEERNYKTDDEDLSAKRKSNTPRF